MGGLDILLLGCWLGGLVPVALQFAEEWRRHGAPRDAHWLPTALLFIAAWPIVSLFVVRQLMRRRGP